MTNEQTIDGIMGQADDYARAYAWRAEEKAALRNMITAALAAKDAEIERLKAQLAEPAEPAPGEWIEWAGGECPLADGGRHSIRKRDGWQSVPDIAAADWYGWRHNGSSADIVAYRVLA